MGARLCSYQGTIKMRKMGTLQYSRSCLLCSDQDHLALLLTTHLDRSAVQRSTHLLCSWERSDELSRALQSDQDELLQSDQDELLQSDQDELLQSDQDELLQSDQDELLQSDQDELLQSRADELWRWVTAEHDRSAVIKSTNLKRAPRDMTQTRVVWFIHMWHVTCLIWLSHTGRDSFTRDVTHSRPSFLRHR